MGASMTKKLALLSAAAGLALVFSPPAMAQWSGGYIGGHGGVATGFSTDALTCTGFEETDGEGQEGDIAFPIFYIMEYPGDDIDEDAPCEWNYTWSSLNPETPFWVEDSLNPAGYLAGFQIGYNMQLGHFGDAGGFVFGAEVATSFANIGDRLNGFVPFFFGAGAEGGSYQADYEISMLTMATARAGIAFGPALAYSRGGIVLAHGSWSDSLGFADDDMATGFVWGVGLEAMIGANVSLFTEFDRMNFTHDFFGTTPGGFDQYPTEVGINTTLNIVKAGFNIHL
jgi:opacity protein-like surface antigen